MTNELSAQGIRLFTTCPHAQTGTPHSYFRSVVNVARWSERAGCTGTLIYSDNAMVDPWLVAQTVIASTRELAPLVAVQPAYLHPYAAAKLVASIAFMYGRRVYLNMVAGGFANDLAALDDRTPHDERYARLTEYTQLVLALLGTADPVTLDGRYYRVTNLRLAPTVNRALMPGVFVSGSSSAGRGAAEQLGALAVCYPKPASSGDDTPTNGAGFGIRVGIIARERSADAWKIARKRFPSDRQGQLTHQMAMKVSDSQWHGELSQLAKDRAETRDPYWMVPFENYKTFCPYLVGSYDDVAAELARYFTTGCRTVILDIPPSEQDLSHAVVAVSRAAERSLR